MHAPYGAAVTAMGRLYSELRRHRPRLPATGLRSGWHGSRTKLRPRDVPAFDHAEPAVFQQVAHAVCSTAVLPRKELFEAWEVASRIDQAFPSIERVADLAAGHGLLGWLLVLLALQDGRPRTAVAVDSRMPPSADTLADAFTHQWPELSGRFDYVESRLENVQADSSVLFASVHACGPLTDAVLARAVHSGAPVAVMPCCHSLRKQQVPAEPGLTPELLAARAKQVGAVRAIDDARIAALEACGYTVDERAIDPEVTPYNRLLLASVRGEPSAPVMAERAETASAWVLRTQSKKERIARGTAMFPVRQIPLADVAAVAAMAGRRPIESRRAIELSMWLPEEATIGEVELSTLARTASASGWRSRDGGKTHAEPPSEPPWDADTAVRIANGEHSEDSHLPPSAVDVSVSLRETYFHPESGRRACAFVVEFSSTDRQLTRGEVGMWQARMREAIQLWAKLEPCGLELR